MQHAVAPHMLCSNCGYDLRGIDSERCPECGQSVDHSATHRSRLPWTYRRHKRWAFLQTCLLVLRRPSALAGEEHIPASLSEARRFENFVLLLVFVPAALSTVAIYVAPEHQHRVRLTSWPMEYGLIALCLICFWIFLKMAAGVPSCFCHPKSLSIEQANNAIALSHYSCAPLVLLVIPTLSVGIAYLSTSRPEDTTIFDALTLVLTTTVPAIIALLAFWRSSVVMIRNFTGGVRDAWSLSLWVPLLWAACLVPPLLLIVAYLQICDLVATNW